jgi:hypothetical protein
MRKTILSLAMLFATAAIGQKVSDAKVPDAAKSALLKKYPQASNVSWEKEKGNFEANWGGKSGENMSVQFTAGGIFVEEVAAISIGQLPNGVAVYVRQHYRGSKITEAGKVKDTKGIIMYEAEVKGTDLIFDEKGNFLKID